MFEGIVERKRPRRAQLRLHRRAGLGMFVGTAIGLAVFSPRLIGTWFGPFDVDIGEVAKMTSPPFFKSFVRPTHQGAGYTAEVGYAGIEQLDFGGTDASFGSIGPDDDVLVKMTYDRSDGPLVGVLVSTPRHQLTAKYRPVMIDYAPDYKGLGWGLTVAAIVVLGLGADQLRRSRKPALEDEDEREARASG